MRTMRLLNQSFAGMGRNKLRAFLVMAGVIIGIAALTVIVSISKAADRRIMRQINNFGPTAMMLFAGGGPPRPPPDRQERFCRGTSGAGAICAFHSCEPVRYRP